jgi:hypothetical protein
VGSGDKFGQKSFETKGKPRQEFLFEVFFRVSTTADINSDDLSE